AHAQDGSFVEITFRDRGVGIAPELVGRVFEPFFTTKPAGHGTGLGLSQVYGFCARAGGTATLQSRPGEGTTVNLYLPAAPAAITDGAQIPAPELERLRGLRILLVEDNDEVATATTAVLESLECVVTRLSTADEAVDHLRARGRELDLLVSDIVMPGSINGIQLATHLRSAHPRLPVLLMSGYSESM